MEVGAEDLEAMWGKRVLKYCFGRCLPDLSQALKKMFPSSRGRLSAHGPGSLGWMGS